MSMRSITIGMLIVGGVLVISLVAYIFFSLPVTASSPQHKGKVDVVLDSGIVTVKVESVKEKMEYAYFEGQRDALLGDVRIAHNDTAWYYIKSCWDGQKVIPKNTCPYETNAER